MPFISSFIILSTEYHCFDCTNDSNPTAAPGLFALHQLPAISLANSEENMINNSNQNCINRLSDSLTRAANLAVRIAIH